MQERLAHFALERERRIEFLKTLTIFNAIIQVGNSVAAAVSKSSSADNRDLSGKAIDELKKLLLPDEAEKLEEKTDRIKRMLQEESARGPIRVKTVDSDSDRKKRARRQRR